MARKNPIITRGNVKYMSNASFWKLVQNNDCQITRLDRFWERVSFDAASVDVAFSLQGPGLPKRPSGVRLLGEDTTFLKAAQHLGLVPPEGPVTADELRAHTQAMITKKFGDRQLTADTVHEALALVAEAYPRK